MKRTLLVSYPRSGTHLVMDILTAYFSSHVCKVCDAHQEEPRPEHTLIKHHDFALDLDPKAYGCEVTIALIRCRDDAVGSWLRSGMGFPGHPATEEAMNEFWNKWANRWAKSMRADWVIAYDLNFTEGMVAAASLMDPDVDEARLRRIIEAVRR